ncbi:MAG: DUF1189 family protein [Elusimicrobiota bacterium]
MLLDPIHSVVNFPFYRGVPRKTFPAAIRYVAFLGLLFSLGVAFAIFVHARPRINSAIDWAATSIPKLTIAEGRLWSSARGPVEVRHPEFPQLAIVIDSARTEAVTPAEMERRKIFVYLTQNAVYVLNNQRLEAHDFSKTEEPQIIDGELFRRYGKAMTMVLYPVALVSTWLFFLIWKPAAALFYSLMALLINAFMNGGLEFPELYKIALYAQTPVVALQLVWISLPTQVPLFSSQALVVALLIVGVYLWQAIRQNILPQEPPVAV